MLIQAESGAECCFPDLEMRSHRQSTRIAIKNRTRIFFVDPSDVMTVVARGNYVLLQQEGGSHLLRESISVMAEKFEPYGFVRIHRSVLVNRHWVDEIRPNARGEYRLYLKGGKQFTVTQTYKKNLQSLAELWLGIGKLISN